MSLRLSARLSFSDIVTRPILKNVGSVKILGKEINFRWKTSQNPKVHQRAVNKILREMNRNIENDELWRGRFFMRQWARGVITYEDHSGMYLWLELRLYDKKTKKYLRWFCDSHDVTGFNGYKVWQKMNDFIVEDLDVWHNEDPRNEKYNWRAASTEKTIRESKSLWQRI